MQAKALLFNRALILVLCFCTSGIYANSGTNSSEEQSNNFYNYECNADTFTLQLNSLSTIWTLIDVLLISIACSIFLMYMCFNKFVNTMTTT